jgi:hypothetical protein
LLLCKVFPDGCQEILLALKEVFILTYYGARKMNVSSSGYQKLLLMKLSGAPNYRHSGIIPILTINPLTLSRGFVILKIVAEMSGAEVYGIA